MKGKEIQELVQFLADSGLEEVNIETENLKLSIKRSPEQRVLTTQSAPPLPATPTPQTAPPLAIPPSQSSAKPESNYKQIKSPMIGTFYQSAKPESPAFVEVGSTIKAGDTVCIIEAMKLFNEVESEISGKVVKVLVENAQPVEFDQPLFLVDPSS